MRGSGLPVPRFVTLKSDEVNMRAGPGTEYPVLWQYRKKACLCASRPNSVSGARLSIMTETTGWMHHSVVSLRRTGAGHNQLGAYLRQPRQCAALVAVAERNALLELQSCPTQWCKVAAGDLRGWVARTALWGLLDGEILELTLTSETEHKNGALA